VKESETFRSPIAVVIWWLWVLFAAGNVADLLVQGHDHFAMVAAFGLLFVTGIVYVTALRPKVVAAADGLAIVNPIIDHQVGWAAVANVDTADLLRVRCEWGAGEERGKRVIYAWAVHSSRRRQAAAQMRQRRQVYRAARDTRGAFGGGLGGGQNSSYGRPGLGGGLFGGPRDNGPAPAPIGIDAGKVIGALTERADLARVTSPDEPAVAPVSVWHWPAVAAILLPGLALLIVALV
jgi:hypothetical protein